MGPTFHYEENMDRDLIIDPTIFNKFLFEVHFENKAYVIQAPGIKTLHSYPVFLLTVSF
jgi:hypothetical protein